jgi:hypothetical protein
MDMSKFDLSLPRELPTSYLPLASFWVDDKAIAGLCLAALKARRRGLYLAVDGLDWSVE